MYEQEQSRSQTGSPETTLTGSLYRATSTMDDLTVALANFSRLPSPDLSIPLVCCCGREDCESAKAWSMLKSKLESRLILSAEVGQALLQKHEAYVHRHEARQTVESASETELDDNHSRPLGRTNSESRVIELLKENVVLDKRLTRAMIDNEIAEASNKRALEELEEARDAISRLTAHHARSVGLESRLNTVNQEMGDVKQERDSQAQRAKLAELRIEALNEKLNKLQTEVRRLQDDLEIQRSHRLEYSEGILQHARERIQALQHSERAKAIPAEEAEFTKVLEGLVEDNELLKRDNEELQTLLSQSRDDCHALQEEHREHTTYFPPREDEPTLSPRYPLHRRRPSSPLRKAHSPAQLHAPGKRDVSRDSRRNFELSTPETERRPLSPAESHTALGSQALLGLEFGAVPPGQSTPPSPGKTPVHKSLFLLSQSRGVQTDEWTAFLSISPLPHRPGSPSLDGARSEASSLTADSQSSALSAIIERVVSFFNRMTQADALSLTNRLKRQHLRGADVGHLSRITVAGISNDATNLRVQFRALLEDDRVPLICTRKDLRALFKLFRDVFMEMGQMRVTLNDVILDPSIASQVRDLAMNPAKANSAKDIDAAASSSTGWIAPIAKLFGSAHSTSDGPTTSEQQQPSSSFFARPSGKRADPRPPPRVVPKLGPALSASATVVNVEFSGIGAGRSVTTTFMAQPAGDEDHTIRIPPAAGASGQGETSNHTSSPNLMGIFAGAPARASATSDSWVKVQLPRTLRRAQSKLETSTGPDRRRPLGLQRGSNPGNRLSRNVDAVIDAVDSPVRHRQDYEEGEEGEECDYVAPLLQRTLRRRGLSDSSIHSTLISHAEDDPSSPTPPQPPTDDSRETWSLNKDSVLRALSRRVQNFRLGAGAAVQQSDTFSSPSGSLSGSELPPVASPSPLMASLPVQQPRQPPGETDGGVSPSAPAPSASPSGVTSAATAIPRRTGSPLSALVPHISLSSWAEAAKMLDPIAQPDMYVGSLREDSFAHLSHNRNER